MNSSINRDRMSDQSYGNENTINRPNVKFFILFISRDYHEVENNLF
jgi:hypothetical protein